MLLLGAALVLCGAEAALSLLDMEGRRIELRAPENDEIVVLHFWATWCPSCLEDLRSFQQASATCSGGRVAAYAINVGESASAIDAFAREHGLSREFARDPSGKVWRSQGARGLPATVFWSTSGSKTDVGPKELDQWSAVFGSLGCLASEVREEM
jgi:peroxiredoxin